MRNWKIKQTLRKVSNIKNEGGREQGKEKGSIKEA